MTRGSPLRSMSVNVMPRKSHSIEAPRSTIASQCSSTGYESAWPMTTRAGSAPASSRMSSWRSPIGDITAWVVTAMPVARAARPPARRTRSSWADTHGLWTPISPMIPGRPGSPSAPSLPATPSANSPIITSASSSTVRRSMSASGG